VRFSITATNFLKLNRANERMIHLGDCKEVLGNLLASGERAFDLVITSPPYNIGKSYEMPMSHADYVKHIKDRLRLVEKLISPSGSLWLNLGYSKAFNGQHFPLAYHFWDTFDTMELRQEVIWYTRRGAACRHYFSPRHETLLWFQKKGQTPFFDLEAVRVPHDQSKCTCGTRNGVKRCNAQGKNPTDVWPTDDAMTSLWDISTVAAGSGRASSERVPHPAQMPQELLARVIRACCPPGGRILDPFAGSGSTLVAAKENGREAVGVEIDPKYVCLATGRLAGISEEAVV